jgi:hypothetical protein
VVAAVRVQVVGVRAAVLEVQVAAAPLVVQAGAAVAAAPNR